MTNGDRDGTGDNLDWIWATPDQDALVERYDRWADSYDDEHDAWGWNGPQHAVATLLSQATPTTILDAGCGTGRVGVELAARGWAGALIGVDISTGMLDRAKRRGYARLIEASLHAVPLGDGTVDAVVSTGVFTHGHVNHEAFPELIRLVRSGGLIVITSREEVWEALEPHAAEIEAAGEWALIGRTEPESFHPGRDVDGRPQSIVTWRVS